MPYLNINFKNAGDANDQNFKLFYWQILNKLKVNLIVTILINKLES